MNFPTEVRDALQQNVSPAILPLEQVSYLWVPPTFPVVPNSANRKLITGK